MMDNVYGSPRSKTYNIYSLSNDQLKKSDEYFKMKIIQGISRDCTNGLLKSVHLLTKSILNIISKEV